MQDRDGRLLFSTSGGGVSLYDGLVLQTLNTGDGLGGNSVRGMMQDSRGDIWICLGDEGVTRYRPVRTPPPVRVVDVVADRSYGAVEELSLPANLDYLAIGFEGRSFKTRPGRLAYVYRMEGYDEEWKTTRDEQVVYDDLPVGEYAFEVRAVDRDLTYSEEPARVRISIRPPYGQLALGGGLLLSLAGLCMAFIAAVRRRRERDQAREAFVEEQQQRLQVQEALNRELEEELQTAHEMQMGLMPEEAPQIKGLEIAGRCLTANHVGGDFFQYFQRDGKLLVCMADVTGHAMEAAIPMVMFSGILESQLEASEKLEVLFGRLNRSLCRTLDRRTFVCFAMGELDLSSLVLRLANGGCPYPYHFRAAEEEVVELEVDAYPLGVSEGAVYPLEETGLSAGDYLVFCSDGIVEAENGEGELFGFERTAEAIGRACAEGLAAEGVIERLIGEVKGFAGGVAQGDDMTVVVKVEKEGV